MNRKITVIQRPRMRLTGIKIQTTNLGITRDRPALWEKILALAPFFLGKHIPDGYGLSTNFEEDGAFTYWAMMNVPPEYLVHSPY